MRTRERQLLSFKKKKKKKTTRQTVTLTRQDYPSACAVIRCLHPPFKYLLAFYSSKEATT